MSVSISKRFAAAGAAATMVVLLAIAATLTVGVGHAWAGDTEYYINYMSKNKTIDTAFYDKEKTSSEYANHLTFVNSEKTIKLVSADKKLEVTVHNDLDAGRWSYQKNWIEVNIKKAGTSKLVFKAGKKKYTVTIIAPKFTFPIKSYMIGDTDYKDAFEKDYYDGLWGTTAISATEEMSGKQLKVVANKGWKINTDPKNGSTIDWGSVTVNATNKKSGMGLAFVLNPW